MICLFRLIRAEFRDAPRTTSCITTTAKAYLQRVQGQHDSIRRLFSVDEASPNYSHKRYDCVSLYPLELISIRRPSDGLVEYSKAIHSEFRRQFALHDFKVTTILDSTSKSSKHGARTGRGSSPHDGRPSSRKRGQCFFFDF